MFFGGIRIKFHLGMAEGRGKRGVSGKRPKRRCFIFAKFPLLSEIQTISHKLLVSQTSIHQHCNQHAQNVIILMMFGCIVTMTKLISWFGSVFLY